MGDHVGYADRYIGKYRLQQLIGHGSFADVYLGEHIHLKNQAAIKVLRAHLKEDEAAHFLYEAQTIARLEHPHIVRILDFEVQAGTPYLIMSYAPNGTIRHCHPHGTRLPLSMVVSYVRQIADALQYAHEQKVIHRDVKPENMLLGRHNEVILSDFGISTMAHSSRSQIAQDVAGTMAYMAPEQIQARPRPASDQYALAVIVYEWLCGEQLFSGTPMEVAGKHVYAAPPSLRNQLPSLSPEVEQVIFTALAKDPRQRFGSILAFARALELASQNQEGTPTFITPMTFSASAFDKPVPFPTLQVAPLQSWSGSAPQTPAPPLSPSAPFVQTPEPFSHHANGYVKTSGIVGNAGNVWSTVWDASEHPLPASPRFQEIDTRKLPVTPVPGSWPVTISSHVSSGSGSMPHDQVAVFKSTRSRRLSSRYTIALIALALLIVLGAATGIFYPVLTAQHATTSSPNTAATQAALARAHLQLTVAAQATATAHAQQQATTTAQQSAINEYNAAIASNGVMKGFDAQHTGYNPYEKILSVTNVSGLVQYWTATTGNSSTSSPIMANGIVYMGSDDGKLYAFDAGTGAVKWATATGKAINSSAAIANGIVYIGSNDGKLYALDAQTGAIKWAVSLGGPVKASPAVSNGIIYVSSINHVLYALDARTGSQKWVASQKYLTDSSPTLFNGLAIVGSHDNRLYAFDARTGEVKWVVSVGNIISAFPTVVNGVVYAGSQNGDLYAFDTRNGSQKWVASTHGIISASPAVANGVVYVGSQDHSIYAFDALTGAQKWATATGNAIYSSPMIANGLVYASSGDDKIYAFDIQTGKQEWSASTGASIQASPMVANGVVYISSNDGKLYTFHLPGMTP